MSKAYIAFGERATLVCAYDKSAPKALKKVAKKVAEMQQEDDWAMLTGINVAYDDDSYYHVTATVSTTA
jgi:hypothetical protein